MLKWLNYLIEVLFTLLSTDFIRLQLELDCFMSYLVLAGACFQLFLFKVAFPLVPQVHFLVC